MESILLNIYILFVLAGVFGIQIEPEDAICIEDPGINKEDKGEEENEIDEIEQYWNDALEIIKDMEERDRKEKEQVGNEEMEKENEEEPSSKENKVKRYVCTGHDGLMPDIFLNDFFLELEYYPEVCCSPDHFLLSYYINSESDHFSDIDTDDSTEPVVNSDPTGSTEPVVNSEPIESTEPIVNNELNKSMDGHEGTKSTDSSVCKNRKIENLKYELQYEIKTKFIN
uniref:Uncharacterized protein n=1 Tax=Clastoptera arizonana TaxID=38151 RepID=A0A1B6C2I2_9HEMI